jgi:hypothetical protein
MALDIDNFFDAPQKPNKKQEIPNVPFKEGGVELVSKNSSRRPNKSKAKGNSYENKIAKLLGTWIFNDNTKLNRSITSGAVKNAYLGDIVPQKQLKWLEWPFLIECKNGYQGNASDFNNTTLLDTWLQKCLKERTDEQPIIWLIVSFHGHQPLFITDLELSISSRIILKQEYEKKFISFYIYKLKDLMEYDFYFLYKHIPELLKVFNI